MVFQPDCHFGPAAIGYPMPSKRHHYIPIMHLKHFVGRNPNGQLWTIEKETGIARSSRPENTALERYFYAAENDDGTFNTGLEEYLAKVEGTATPIYEKMLTGWVPGPGYNRGEFSLFLALLYLRTPAMRRDAAESIGRNIQLRNYDYGNSDHKFEEIVQLMEKESGRTYDPSEKEKFRKWLIDPRHYTLEVPKERTFMALAHVKDLAPIFLGMHWSLLRPEHGFFITSDNPVVRFNQDVVGSNWTEVSFPLSPRLLLVMTRDPAPKNGMIERDLVWSINRMRASYADEYLFSHVVRKNLKKLALEFKGSRPRLSDQKWNSPIEFTKTELLQRRNKSSRWTFQADIGSLRRL